MASSERRDPLEEERARAREASDGGGDELAGDGSGDDAVHPSLGSPPRRDESRPLFRSSQLQREEDKPDEAPPLRG